MAWEIIIHFFWESEEVIWNSAVVLCKKALDKTKRWQPNTGQCLSCQSFHLCHCCSCCTMSPLCFSGSWLQVVPEWFSGEGGDWETILFQSHYMTLANNSVTAWISSSMCSFQATLSHSTVLFFLKGRSETRAVHGRSKVPVPIKFNTRRVLTENSLAYSVQVRAS